MEKDSTTDEHRLTQITELASPCSPWFANFPRVPRVPVVFLYILFFVPQVSYAEEKLDPAAWGENHAGQAVPQLDEGSQCLFCHRGTVGINWDQDRHNKALRLAEESPEGLEKLKETGVDSALSAEIQYVLGGERQHVYLKPSKAYGTADMFSIRYNPKTQKVTSAEAPTWQEGAFNKSCAGCHATAYDTAEEYYQTLSLDCYTCHNQPPLSHTENPEQALFSVASKTPARVTMSVCGSCHIRDGKSKTTRRPHANNFMPGDNLFQDLEVDWSDAAMEKLNPMDKHVMLNVRDVVVNSKDEMTCLTCHGIHNQSTTRHKKLKDAAYCFICHKGADTKSGLHEYQVSSETCGY